MRKNIKWFILAIAILLLGIIIYAASDDDEVVLADAMKIITGQDSYVSTSGEVDALAYYGNMYLTNREKKELLVSLAQNIGIRDEFEFGASWDLGRDTVYLYKKGIFSEIKLGISTIETVEGDESTYAQYILCNLSIEDSPESVCYYARVITDELAALGLNEEVTATLVSCYDSEFDEDECSRFTDEILKDLGAKVVVENRSKELFSVYAYAADMAEGIVVGNDEINLNIAINYNEAAKQTRVYIAAPILEKEY